MTFGRWYALAEAASHAPEKAGIFQIRLAKGLIDYPRGKSAMLYYGCAPDLRTAITSFAELHPGADWWCRHTTEMTLHEADDLGTSPPTTPMAFDRLMKRFELRFGQPPTLP